MNKAEQVSQAYNDTAWDNIHSEGCYRCAIATAHELGGIEIYNSNDDSRTFSYAPTREFEFDDSSSVWIEYGGVYL